MGMPIVGVLLSGVAAMIVGSVWYSPIGFAKPWRRLSGITEAKIEGMKKKGIVTTYLIAFLVCLVKASALALILRRLGIETLLGAVITAKILWLGFVAPVLVSGVLWEGKPWGLFAIHAGHYLVSLVIMALILVRML